MANKAISELPQAQNVNNQDLFVLEQSGIAKKLTAETFITEQGIIDALAEALDGHGGIQSVTLSSVSGRIRTYLITFTDASATTFQVLDGTSIDRIVKTSTAGLTDTYTVFMNDGTTTFFTVTNGADGTVSEEMLNDALKDKAPAITETTESSAIATFSDGADDMPLHNILAEINPVQDLPYGDPYPAGGGKNLCPVNTISGVGWASDNADLLAVINSLPEGTYNMSFLSTLTSLDSDSYVSATWITGFNFTNPNGNFNNQATTNSSHPVNSTQTANKALTITSSTAGAFTHAYVYGAGNNSNGKIGTATISKIQIESGSTATTYAPYSNICPISGWTGCNVTRAGKNLLDIDKWTINPNVPMTISGGTITLTNSGYQESRNKYILPDKSTYTLSFHVKTISLNSPSASFATYFDGVKTAGKTGTDRQGNIYLDSVDYERDIVYTVTGKSEIAFGGWAYGGTVEISNIQLELGSTATAYESYQDSSVTIDWTTEAGTVYGGTIDVATGLLTVDAMLEVFDQISGDEIMSQIDYCLPNTGVSTVGDYTRIAFGIRGDIQRSDYNLISSSYKFKMCNMLKHYFAYVDESSHWYRNTSLYAFFPSSLVGTTATSVINYLKSIKDTNPLSFWLPLAHPQTYQLTPQQIMTLLGTNNVWADTGNVSVTYPADTKMFIEKLTQPTEDDMTANQAITSGKFFMVGNNLYIATAAIASGAKIIEGTNATRLSLADALNRLK